jgi:SAM-dependent methyltransferase
MDGTPLPRSLEEYRDNWSREYARGSFETLLAPYRRKRILTSLRAHRHDHILEVGCGLEPLFAHWPGEFRTYTIVEQIPEFAAAARDQARSNPQVQVVADSIESAASTLAGEYDFIILSGWLHETPHPARILELVRGLCGAGTTIHVNVPNVRSVHRLLAEKMGLIPAIDAPSGQDQRYERQVHFDQARLRELLESAGFSVVESGSYFVKPFSNEQMEQLLASGIVPRSILDGLDALVEFMPELGCEIFADARPRLPRE